MNLCKYKFFFIIHVYCFPSRGYFLARTELKYYLFSGGWGRGWEHGGSGSVFKDRSWQCLETIRAMVKCKKMVNVKKRGARDKNIDCWLHARQSIYTLVYSSQSRTGTLFRDDA